MSDKSVFPRLGALVLSLMVLSACVPSEAVLKTTAARLDTSDCALSAGGAGCFFVNSPVKLKAKPIKLPNRPYDFFPTAQQLRFVDGTGRRWEAPTETLTDGASIPVLFVPLVGNPRTREFANASALHDAYCGVGNEDGANWHNGTWQSVHRMFYDTLVVSGTHEIKAKIMFAAVWLGGPRWYATGRPDARLALLPDRKKVEAMQSTISFIKVKKPTIARLIKYLEWKEREMFRELDHLDAAREAVTAPSFDPNNPITTSPGGGLSSGGGQGAIRP